MPFVNIKIAGPSLALAQVRRLQAGVTTLLADCLRRKRELTAVLVEQVPGAGWMIDSARR